MARARRASWRRLAPRVYEREDAPGRYWARYQVGGARRADPLRAGTLAEARAEADQLWHRALGEVPARRRPADSGQPLSLALTRWVSYRERCVEAGELRAPTVRMNDAHGLHLVRLLPGDVAAIDAAAVERYRDARIGEGVKPATVYKEICTLRRLLDWCARQGWIAAAPVIRLKAPRCEYVPVWLSP